MDQSKFADVEERIVCPYDHVHEISRLRMANHLQRCRLQHLELSQKLVTCAFNYTHKIPKPEIEFHKTICPDRDTFYASESSVGTEEQKCLQILLENFHETICPDRDAFYSFEYSVGTKENESVQELLKRAEKKIEIEVPQTESWDCEVDQPGTNVLNAIVRDADDRGVLKCHQNMPPSERKMKREEDRQKMKARLNAEEEAKTSQNQKVSSVVSTPSAWPALNERPSTSGAGLSSACSVMSDSSYSTAMNTVTGRMREFQVVKKKGRGRSAKAESTPSTSLAGVGRGRARPRQDSNCK